MKNISISLFPKPSLTNIANSPRHCTKPISQTLVDVTVMEVDEEAQVGRIWSQGGPIHGYKPWRIS